MSLRQRRGAGGGGDFLSGLRDFDAYAKPLDDFKVKTISGATVTLVSAVIISLLVITEFVDWRSVQIQPSLIVDRERKEKMWLNFNITFSKVPCYILSVDVMDVAGEHQNDIFHDIFKVRLDPNEKPHVDKPPEKHEINQKTEVPKEVEAARNITSSPGYCGSCYGGVAPSNGCCNTCDDVKKAYTDKGWSFSNPENIEQCIAEGYVQKMIDQHDEGCLVYGHIEVNKVAGNFHFAPGKSFQQSNMHVHDLQPYLDGKNWDFRHTITNLAFGREINFKNPLDGVKKHTTERFILHVVGTKYSFLNGTTIHTNQFSATEHERDLTPSNGLSVGGLPENPIKFLKGVFFNFDISPMLVTMKEYKKPFTHFLTNVCAIVGGIFTVAGILDSFIYTAEKTLKKKVDLGKST
ncbi:Endoplasmic reticulum-Golgi intermediate compartment protein 3, partial [Nowakowskiella sp. JEL0078]